MTNKLMYGVEAGQRWIAGMVPLKRDTMLKIDTRNSIGVSEVLEAMKEPIAWQARKIRLPGFSAEDVIQELNLIVLIAIPDYDIERGTNLCTFLQNHLQNRTLNLFKFATERRRTATHENYRLIKIKCPECRHFSVVNQDGNEQKSCRNCGLKQDDSQRWIKYPLQINALSASQQLVVEGPDFSSLQDLATYEDMERIGGGQALSQDRLIGQIAIKQAWQRQDELGKLIIQHLMDGQGSSDISRLTGLSAQTIKTKIAKIKEGCEL